MATSLQGARSTATAQKRQLHHRHPQQGTRWTAKADTSLNVQISAACPNKNQRQVHSSFHQTYQPVCSARQSAHMTTGSPRISPSMAMAGVLGEASQAAGPSGNHGCAAWTPATFAGLAGAAWQAQQCMQRDTQQVLQPGLTEDGHRRHFACELSNLLSTLYSIHQHMSAAAAPARLAPLSMGHQQPFFLSCAAF